MPEGGAYEPARAGELEPRRFDIPESHGVPGAGKPQSVAAVAHAAQRGHLPISYSSRSRYTPSHGTSSQRAGKKVERRMERASAVSMSGSPEDTITFAAC